MATSNSHSQIFSWLQLMRVANWPSAASNVLSSFLVANQNWERWDQLVLLLIISLCLFAGGMVLNDWHDADYDRAKNMDRPIPTGRISQRSALRLAWALFGMAFLLAVVIYVRAPPGLGWMGLRSLGITSTTIVFIWMYDVLFKRNFTAPIWMGLCRAGNFFLGASTAEVAGSLEGFPPTIWVLGGLLGLYVCGVTAYARRESEVNSREPLVGPLLILGAIILYGLSPIGITDWDPWNRRLEVFRFELLVAVTGALFINRLLISWFLPGPRLRKSAIIYALRSIIVIDSAICMLFSQGNFFPALVVIALLPVSMVLSRIHSLT